jgi:membrane fusion protein (multidrug efflux system)
MTGRKQFFFAKKNQKTFLLWGVPTPTTLAGLDPAIHAVVQSQPSPQTRNSVQPPSDLAARDSHCLIKRFSAGIHTSKSFLLLFFKREVLACLLPIAAYAQEPAATVSTIVARPTPWQDSLQAVGTLRAVRGADLASEVSGVVDTVDFDSGRDVAAGTILLRLRPNDDAAHLADLQAAADLAAANLARDTKQFRAQAVSQASIDADESHLRSARAQVAQAQALQNEKIVRAPFAGRLGLRVVDQGQYLAAGTTIVTLQALDTLYVDFYLPQQALAEVHGGETASLSVDAFPGRSFAAHIDAISPKVDPVSRMAQIRATLPNPGHALLPGMFATVQLHVGPVHPYLTLPNAAIVYNPYGSLVYVVDHGAARQAVVRTGPTRGDQVAVLAGLREGDVVVTAGQIKLRQGSPVVVNNSVQPANDPNPHPAEE